MTLRDYLWRHCSKYEWNKGEKRVISVSENVYFANVGADSSKSNCIGVPENPYDILRTMPHWANKPVAITYGLVHEDQNIYLMDL